MEDTYCVGNVRTDATFPSSLYKFNTALIISWLVLEREKKETRQKKQEIKTTIITTTMLKDLLRKKQKQLIRCYSYSPY